MDNNLTQIALFNTFLGLLNYSFNTTAIQRQKDIEAKLDEILELLHGKQQS